MKNGLTIIIPAHNEEELIINTLIDLKEHLTFSCKIIVIDDHSTDFTAGLVKKYAKRNGNVSLIGNYGSNKGFSSTLKIGFNKARTEYVLPVMADLCDDPKTINKIYSKIDENWDIICGSRYMKGGKKNGGSKLQGFFSTLVCRSLKVFIGIPTHDVSNAFKAYKKSILRQVKIRDGAGVEISMEITLQAFFNGAKITEIPTYWKGRTAGASKFKIIQRSPKYAKIFFWSLKNSLLKNFGVSYDAVYRY